MTILAREFRRAFRKGESKHKKFVKKYGSNNDSQSRPHKKKEGIYYECNKSGRIIPNYPKNIKKKGKEDKGEKTTTSVWDARNDSSSDELKDKDEVDVFCMCLLYGTWRRSFRIFAQGRY